MDFSSSRQWIDALWLLFGVYWLASALERKKTKQRESILQRFVYTLPLAVGFYLLYQPQPLNSWFRTRFLPTGPFGEWLGVVLTAAGIGVAFWARWHLGTNWSGTVTLKEGHELIRTGPYRSIRHPIYTGILLALFGTAITFGEVRALLAVAIAWLSFYVKARREESFLSQEFGPGFAEHKQHTGMFLPRFS
ncbi:MAG TPA: isoprenylcysteine carboxylmethyltransferase family protein [Candidatus Acidoferrum sp.]|nr:isoprenylcysteine carboxylmethyltransferase family protein [Candidatus Acidoferrum sp.]